MLKDLSEQNDELKEAFKTLEKEQEWENDFIRASFFQFIKKELIFAFIKKRNKKEDSGFGVPYEEYKNLGERVGKMESSMGLIIGKIDAVLLKLEAVEREKNKPPRNVNNKIECFIFFQKAYFLLMNYFKRLHRRCLVKLTLMIHVQIRQRLLFNIF